MEKYKIFKALVKMFDMATVILFFAWILTDHISGWYWFWTGMGYIFFKDLCENE